MTALGKLQRRIWRAFVANPGGQLTTGELVRWCYPRMTGRALNKHRFATRRAADVVADRVAVGWRGSIVWKAKAETFSAGTAHIDAEKQR